MSLPQPFAYPICPHTRKHAPAGYEDYKQYKNWLRDEFDFRCVYCLRRETWSSFGCRAFSIDHILPQVDFPDPQFVCGYSNLIYACVICNSNRRNNYILDPTEDGMGEHLRVDIDSGYISAVTYDGHFLIELLHLNSESMVRERRRVFRILSLYLRYSNDAEVRCNYLETFGYPSDLMDLRRRHPYGPIPPGGNPLSANTEHCAFARRERGDLPPVYSVGVYPRLVETV